MRSFIGLLAILVLVAACTSQTVPDDSESRDSLTRSCTNPAHGFTVSYPAGWQINDGKILAPCTAFNPEPVVIPEASEMPFDIAVVIDVEPVPLSTLSSSSMYQRIVSSEELTVDGQRAMFIESESTGDGLADAGMRTFTYAMDLGNGETLVMTSHDVGELSFEEKKDIVRQMARSLSLPQHMR